MAATLISVGVAASPAHAESCGEKVKNQYCSTAAAIEEIALDIHWNGSPAYEVYGQVSHTPETYPVTTHLYVQQCNVKMSRCDVIAANSAINKRFNILQTRWAETAHGHVYRACASWTTVYAGNATNTCSRFVAA